MPTSDDSPYRHDLAAAFARIAELERALASQDRPGADSGTLRALAALRLAHLREDRERLIEEFRTDRGTLFGGTAVAMVATFLAFARSAFLHPWRAGPLWFACGAAVVVLAVLCGVAQTLLLARARSRLRAIDRRRAEEAILFGGIAHASPPEAEAHDATGIRVAADPLVEPPFDEVALLTGGARRSAR